MVCEVGISAHNQLKQNDGPLGTQQQQASAITSQHGIVFARHTFSHIPNFKLPCAWHLPL